MSIMTKIAWRNLWRNTRRTTVLVLVIAIGVFSFLGAVSFMDGISAEMIRSSLHLQGGHIQIAQEGYQENPDIKLILDDVRAIEQSLAGAEGMAVASRISSPGMVNSAEQAAGVVILGVDPVIEPTVTSVAESVVEGTYLEAEGGDASVVIGQAMAEKLNVTLGEKVVLMANDLDNEIGAGAFRVVGLFKSTSSDFDKSTVFITQTAARDLIGYGPGQASVVSLRLDPGVELAGAMQEVRARLPQEKLEVLSWEDRYPMLVVMLQMYDYSGVLLVVILFTAIAFTIINSFLMVIFERIHEIGIMSANGVRPRQIRAMLYLESVFIVLFGCALGTIVALGFIGYWSRVGLDLSTFAEGLNAMGIGSMIYPQLNWGHIGNGFGAILVMVLLAVFYPAFKASRFEAVDAINYV